MVLAALVLSGCGTSTGHSYALQACQHVDKSLGLLRRARAHPTATDAAALRSEALKQLRIAQPLASLAASDDSQWQALEFTVSESSRVSEANLVHALAQQCQAVQSGPATPEPSPGGPSPSGAPPTAPGPAGGAGG